MSFSLFVSLLLAMFEFFGVHLKHAINLHMWEYCNIIMVHKP